MLDRALLNLKFLKIVTSFCYEFVFRRRLRGADDWQTITNNLTNLLSNFQEFLDEEELSQARFFIDFMLQNVILLKNEELS